MRPRPLYFLAVLLFAASCGGAVKDSPAASPSTETLTASDGSRIAATYYPAPAPGAAGLVLLHMLGSTRSQWDAFARHAQHEGYACIAIDLRGHGNSLGPGGEAISYKSFDTQDWLDAMQDIDAAKTALVRHGADPDNLAIAGANIGASLALRYAASHEDIQAVVMLSPGLDYQGIAIEQDMAAYGKRPSLMMTTTGDSYSTTSAVTLKAIAPGFCELREYGGSAHGVDILDAEPPSTGQIFLWLKHIVGPQAAAANRAK